MAYKKIILDETDSVNSTNIKSSAVTTAKIADSAVTSAKIAANTITTSDMLIGNTAISGYPLLFGPSGGGMFWNQIDTGAIANDAVTNGKIADEAIDNNKLADNAILDNHISDSAVTTAKINGSAVTTAKIANDAVTSAKLADFAVSGEIIADEGINSGKLADNSVGTDNISNLAVTSAKIANDSIDANKLNPIANGSSGYLLQYVAASTGITWASPSTVGATTGFDKNYQHFCHNFYDDIGNFTHYIPWNTGNETTTTLSSNSSFLAVDTMDLKKISIKPMQFIGTAFTLTVRAYRANNNSSSFSMVDSITMDWNVGENYHANESTDLDCTLSSGQTVAIYIDANVDPGGTIHWLASTVWEVDRVGL